MTSSNIGFLAKKGWKMTEKERKSTEIPGNSDYFEFPAPEVAGFNEMRNGFHAFGLRLLADGYPPAEIVASLIAAGAAFGMYHAGGPAFTVRLENDRLRAELGHRVH
jgi:hypothetical protein